MKGDIEAASRCLTESFGRCADPVIADIALDVATAAALAPSPLEPERARDLIEYLTSIQDRGMRYRLLYLASTIAANAGDEVATRRFLVDARSEAERVRHDLSDEYRELFETHPWYLAIYGRD